MEKEEMKELLEFIENAYPRFYPDDKAKAKRKAQLWASYMKDWDYDRTKKYIRRHIEESVFEPKIAEVKAPIRKELSIYEKFDRDGVPY